MHSFTPPPKKKKGMYSCQQEESILSSTHTEKANIVITTTLREYSVHTHTHTHTEGIMGLVIGQCWGGWEEEKEKQQWGKIKTEERVNKGIHQKGQGRGEGDGGVSRKERQNEERMVKIVRKWQVEERLKERQMKVKERVKVKVE